MSKQDDIISKNDYDTSHPVYIKIRKDFSKKLKSKYNCADFDKIIDYIMDFVFHKKATKSECISNMNSLFKGKAEEMIDYLWKITRHIENSSSDSDYSEKSGENKYNRNIRERSRSHSYERKNKFNYNKYNANLTQRGLYTSNMQYGFLNQPFNIPYYKNFSQFMFPNPALIQR